MEETELTTKLTAALEPAAESHGFELVAVERSGGRGTPVIRALLDREGGVDLDAIISANAWVSDVIDAEDPLDRPYTLEVSSPGVDRPLVKLGDFDRFSGQTAAVKAKPQGGRSAWTGTIVGTDGTDVVLDVDGERVSIPFETIQKARLKGVVDFGKGKGQSS